MIDTIKNDHTIRKIEKVEDIRLVPLVIADLSIDEILRIWEELNEAIKNVVYDNNRVEIILNFYIEKNKKIDVGVSSNVAFIVRKQHKDHNYIDDYY